MSDGKKALADKAIALGSAQAKRRYDSSLPGPSFVEKIQHSILDALDMSTEEGLGEAHALLARLKRRFG